MDTIYIKKLRISTIIGIYEWEQHIKQKLFIDIKFKINSIKAGKSDNISDTVDYADITNLIIQHIEIKKFKLIECVAEEVANIILQHTASMWVQIIVYKPFAIIQAKYVSIKIERNKYNKL
uniref:7,8-dihydroneopterin aldolase n=1 Tax=Candidatus Aschnera chinzeii TaxID=1485666 RepID=A0AAT9G4D9_9ENTR|nr:MAG: bifunctional dihydroneopterin aldolase/7,8-dihydroneopterin epimerase [Candidatus Aschnera chinzeii]